MPNQPDIDIATPATNSAADKTWAIIGFLLFGFVIFVNWQANALPINGLTTAQVSDRYPNLFVPAGFIFAIWGLIYLLLTLFSITNLVNAFQLRPRFKPSDALRRVRVLFAISCVLNAGWILAWHHLQISLSVVIMLCLLVCLSLIFQRLLPFRNNLTGTDAFLLRMPFTVYLGWISVATIANISAYLVSVNWTGAALAPETWAKTMIITAAVLGLVMLAAYRQSAFALVLVWAFYGIHEKQELTAVAVGDMALYCAVVLLVGALVSAIRQTSVMRKIKTRVGSLR